MVPNLLPHLPTLNPSQGLHMGRDCHCRFGYWSTHDSKIGVDVRRPMDTVYYCHRQGQIQVDVQCDGLGTVTVKQQTSEGIVVLEITLMPRTIWRNCSVEQ